METILMVIRQSFWTLDPLHHHPKGMIDSVQYILVSSFEVVYTSIRKFSHKIKRPKKRLRSVTTMYLVVLILYLSYIYISHMKLSYKSNRVVGVVACWDYPAPWCL